MTELAKCRCGADDSSFQRRGDVLVARYCISCGTRSPWRDTGADADAAWNALMRRRPVAEWRGYELWCGALRIGRLHRMGRARGATYHISGQVESFIDFASARAWLEERAKAAGFDVRGE